MFFKAQISLLARFVLILVLWVGMFGAIPAKPVHAATITVTNTNPSGPGSLASAIISAAQFGDTVIFDPSLAGQTITFSSQLTLFLSQGLTIDGSGLNPPVVVSGGNATKIMELNGIGTVTISDLAFTNGVSGDGGVIETQGQIQLILENCAFYQNQASSSGGAISMNGTGGTTIINSTFYQNHADGSGGAIAVQGNGPHTILNSTFIENSAGGDGGAIYSGFDIALIDSTFSRNIAGGGGGAIYSPVFDIKNTTIEQNHADFDGGAIYITGNGSGTIVNSTIAQNQAGRRGGAISANGNVRVDVFNSTFAGNNAPEGSEVGAFGIGEIVLSNTIMACVPGNNGCIYHPFGSVGGPNTIIATGTLASFGLAELADNGGPTQTMALLPGSPLIDAGDDSICANSYVNNLDQRGVARPQGSHCDIGAYEDQFIVRYVKQDATGAKDGSRWEDAHTDLQSALVAASPDEEIWVAAGTYKPTSTADRAISFTLKNGVAIYGGFAGTETARTQRDYETNPTILSGDIGVQGDNGDNSYHVVVGSNTNSSAILDGFTITGGKTEETLSLSPEHVGGGMYNKSGGPKIANVILTGNEAAFGGGMYNGGDFGDPESGGDPVLTNVVFQNNSAIEGGGLFNENHVRMILTEVTFDGNTAVRAGGGMEDRLGYLSLTNVVFKNNTAGLAAGGLQNFSTSSNLTNVTFHGNSATMYGGGLVNADADANLDPTLTNVTLYGNSAEFGGGMWNHQSNPILTNVTFYSNSASTSGGGIYSESNSNIAIKNTIFWGNTAPDGAQIYNDNTSVPIVSDTVVQDGFADGTDIITTDPLLGSLGNYGGFTETIPLRPGSSAIDTGNDSNCPPTDQRGVARPQGSHCDIGAYEADYSSIEVSIGNSKVGSYLLMPHVSQRKTYPGVNNGPVKVINPDGVSIMAAERVIYKVNNIPTSFSEMMGLPNSQLDTTYWLPWYNNIDLDTQLRFANLSGSMATVHVYIAGQEMVGSPFSLAAGASIRKSFAGVNKGPVKIESNVSLVASQRAIYKVNGINTSYSEMMALPNSQLNTMYWLPWYNNVELDTQLRFANVSGLPATVHVYIAGQEMPGSPFTLASGASIRKSFVGVNNGPVKIESNVNIVAAERVIYKANGGVNTSFSEMMGLPNGQLDNTYWMPWYNNVDLDTQLRFANVSNGPATVHVYMGGQEMPGSPFTLLAGQSMRKSFVGVNKGPVQIASDIDIVAAERVIYKINGTSVSFSEMMGLPNSQLDTTYWMPWYNNVDLDTQLRFGVP